VIDYLKNPEKYTRAGATIPKGLLLTGAPGTGKTLMARALAGEANCSFFYKSGAEFEEIYVGVGAKRVRELFDKARKSAPSIIFIDEIDALAGQRNPMQNSTVRGTINQILGEMDGFRQTDNIIVIGATNLEKSIDKAILRPGRFDKVINIPYPDFEGRRKILEYY
jgi:ATP-dependent metalloprotease